MQLKAGRPSYPTRHTSENSAPRTAGTWRLAAFLGPHDASGLLLGGRAALLSALPEPSTESGSVTLGTRYAPCNRKPSLQCDLLGTTFP